MLSKMNLNVNLSKKFINNYWSFPDIANVHLNVINHFILIEVYHILANYFFSIKPDCLSEKISNQTNQLKGEQIYLIN